jgi:hypothetical protein
MKTAPLAPVPFDRRGNMRIEEVSPPQKRTFELEIDEDELGLLFASILFYPQYNRGENRTDEVTELEGIIYDLAEELEVSIPYRYTVVTEKVL